MKIIWTHRRRRKNEDAEEDKQEEDHCGEQFKQYDGNTDKRTQNKHLKMQTRTKHNQYYSKKQAKQNHTRRSGENIQRTRRRRRRTWNESWEDEEQEKNRNRNQSNKKQHKNTIHVRHINGRCEDTSENAADEQDKYGWDEEWNQYSNSKKRMDINKSPEGYDEPGIVKKEEADET